MSYGKGYTLPPVGSYLINEDPLQLGAVVNDYQTRWRHIDKTSASYDAGKPWALNSKPTYQHVILPGTPEYDIVAAFELTCELGDPNLELLSLWI